MKTLFKLSLLVNFILSFTYSFAQNNDNDSTYFIAFDTPPEYIGGDAERKKFMKENIKYPEDILSLGIQGTVYVSFVIEKDGSITNSKILKGISSSADEEALRVMKLMPKWKPAIADNKTIRSQFNMPIKFVIQHDNPIKKELTKKEKRALKKKQKNNN